MSVNDYSHYLMTTQKELAIPKGIDVLEMLLMLMLLLTYYLSYQKEMVFMQKKERILTLTQSQKMNSLQYYITDFVVEIGYEAGKERYNKSWGKLWRRIATLGLFEHDTQNKRSQ